MAIREFLDEFPQAISENMTTSQINRAIIKPQTEGTGVPFINGYLYEKSDAGIPFVAPATVFVSHAWRYPFSKTVVDVMEQFAKENENTYFWFDMFTNDQNAIATKDFNWFSTTFRDSIRSIGEVLLVLSPWNDPMPLKRAWCLFEIFNSLTEADVKLTVKLPLSEVNELAAAIEDDQSCLIQALSDIQAQKAEATSDDDKKLIFEVIESSQGGYSHVNENIKRALREWYVLQLRQLVKDHRNNPDLLLSIATVTRDLGSLDESLEINKICLGFCEQADASKDYKACVYDNIANVYRDKNQLDSALDYYTRSMKLSIELTGLDHPNVAGSYNNIAIVSFDKGDYTNALVNFQKALDIRISHLGSEHAEVSDTYNNMANAYREKGEPKNALDYFNKSLVIARKTSGESHPSVAAAYNNIANVYKDMCELDTSLEYRNKSLAIRIEVLGEEHPFVAGCYNGIANIYHDKGEMDLALEYHQKSLKIRRNGLGENHTFVADSLNNMGNVYLGKGDFVEALAHMEKGLAIRIAAYGQAHPSTAMSYSSMSKVFHKQGKLDKAVEIETKALNMRRNLLGDQHISLAHSYNLLGEIHQTKGEIDKALQCFESSQKLLLNSYGDLHPAAISVNQRIAELHLLKGEQ